MHYRFKRTAQHENLHISFVKQRSLRRQMTLQQTSVKTLQQQAHSTVDAKRQSFFFGLLCVSPRFFNQFQWRQQRIRIDVFRIGLLATRLTSATKRQPVPCHRRCFHRPKLQLPLDKNQNVNLQTRTTNYLILPTFLFAPICDALPLDWQTFSVCSTFVCHRPT